MLVIGGGLAGLSAAEALARNHPDRFEVTLLESKRRTGGRAGSFIDPLTGESIDYCQHVAMGCCTNLIALLKRCGLHESMQRYNELHFLHPDHPPSRFAASRMLPAPLHLAASLNALPFLNRGRHRQIRRGLLRLFRARDQELKRQTAGRWLRANGQDEATIRDFWSVIIVSALGEHTDCVVMSAVRKVFVDGFAAARAASDILVPRSPLGELVGQRLCAAIDRLGVKIVTGQTVRRIIEVDQGVVAETRHGARYPAEHVVSAVPWHSVNGFLSRIQLPDVDRFSEFPTSPITGLHLWLDQDLTMLPHAVMVGTVAQWLFRQPWNRRPPDSTHYYQVVISASQEAQSVPRAQLAETVLGELRTAFPEARDVEIVRYRLVSDPNAVFSLRPEIEALRPQARTALPWLHLAGDWTATGWPATMEGAVISGRMAVSSLLGREGMGTMPVDPGLPRGWLARLILGPG